MNLAAFEATTVQVAKCYRPANMRPCKPTWDEEQHSVGRQGLFICGQILSRDKGTLNIFRLKDDSLKKSALCPTRTVSPAEIAEALRSAREHVESVPADLRQRATEVNK